MVDKRIIGLAIGDPAGIGPEVALKAAIAIRSRRPDLKVLLAGSAEIIEQALCRFGLPATIQEVSNPESAMYVDTRLPVYDLPGIPQGEYTFGAVNPECARAASLYVTELVGLAIEGRIAAVACAPISKQALMMIDEQCVGHAELIARLTGSTNFGMLCLRGDFAVMGVTGHVPLADVPARVTFDNIMCKLRLAADTYCALKRRMPRIAVCSLDPHCGEGGLLGRADEDIVRPAVDAARKAGFTVDGPIAADAVFRPYIRSRYDLIVGMYHDQIKVGIAAMDSDRFVAYLAGVPIVRTTTTHGAALDIAGQGSANPENMTRTIELAADIAELLPTFRPVPSSEQRACLQEAQP